MLASAAKASVLSTRPEAQSHYPPWKQRFRPCTLGFIGLAILVALWGYGYKLSLYHRDDQHAARGLVAKLWIEPRHTSALPASKLKAKSHVIPGSHALLFPIQVVPNLRRAVNSILPPPARDIAYSNLLIPSRSPPSLRFFVA